MHWHKDAHKIQDGGLAQERTYEIGDMVCV